jgi:lipopolysaccharide transport system ATP-binding protein
MADIVLTVSNLSKKYSKQLRRSLAYAVRDVGRELWPGAAGAAGLRPGEFWALDDVSFELRRGEAMGIVGQNGAGKSTLLKALYGLIKPDRGEIRIRGRTEALIELGTGFNGLLSGRENVRVGAVLHGFDARRTERLVDEVVDFAELAEFIDAPVQSYSTGMRARLAYALASRLEPDLLLVDEVLAVGDFAFQRKCFNHMRGYLDNGGTLLFVSHNTIQIQSICQHGLLLEHGRAVFRGSAIDTLNALFESRFEEFSPGREHVPGDGPVAITAVRAERVGSGPIQSGRAVRLTLAYEARERVEASWGFSIWTGDQWVCVIGASAPGSVTLEHGQGAFSCVIPRLPLVGGRYGLRVAIVDSASGLPFAHHGWTDAPTMLEVRADPGAAARTKNVLHPLVTVDVDWG